VVGLDLVVARVGAALSRGHGLFSPAPLDGSAALAGSSEVLGSASRRVGDGVQMLDAQGQFGRSYGGAGVRLAGRLAAAGGLDRVLGGIAGDAASSDGQGRAQSGEVVAAAGGDVARVGPYANTPAGQEALLRTLRDRVDEQRRVIAAYRERDARLAAMVRQLRYGRAGGGGGLGSMLGGMPAGMGGGTPSGTGGGGLGGMPGGWNLLSGLMSGARSPGSGGSTPRGSVGTPLGGLTLDSSPRDVAAAIIHEAQRRGYSPRQAIAILSAAMQESGLRPRAVSPNGLWESIFQQDSSYRGRGNPNTAISEFFDRLEHHGGPSSPDIWKSIFWLQQRPGEPSAETAVAHGRQAYLTELLSQLPKATAMYRDIAGIFFCRRYGG
jgi:Domain of unknown function (DUF4226)